MSRKIILKKKKVEFAVNGSSVTVTFHPPTGDRMSWYAYWKGLVASRSTGHLDFEKAVEAVEAMICNGGKKSTVESALLSEEEFLEIQRRHYSKKTDPAARIRSQKSFGECHDAITAFREITGLKPFTLATPDDCERFQRIALEKPKNWRVRYSDRTQRKRQAKKQAEEVEKLSANTVVKWSVALQAAFERANRNSGKKCVRGVVPESKLLTENPWRRFTWIEGFQRKVRHFDHQELLALLDFLDATWPGIAFAPAFVKVMLWSWARRLEVSGLQWSDERSAGDECHFESIGKWGVKKWFRLPQGLRSDLEMLKTSSPYVFGCYPEQLRQFHLRNGDGMAAKRVRIEFLPENLGDWMYRQVCEWSASLPKGTAYLHVFRKTTLQHALSGEHIEQAVAEEARLSPSVMRASYARNSDDEFRRMSSRTYQRIRSSLPVEVAVRYGYEERPGDRLIEQLDLARSQGDWATVSRLAEELRREA